MKIGFIDYWLDEWHANNYPAWIEQANAKLGLNAEIAYAWAEDSAPAGKLTSAQWCGKFGVQLCETMEEVCEKSDVLMILAPANPEKHLPYAERALKYGKLTYIDKTFAPDAATAEKIFALGERYGAKFFSTSALRYGTEMDGFERVQSVIVTGGGRSLDEYVIHQIEMIVRLMGTDAKSVVCFGSVDSASCAVDFGGGRAAVINYGAEMPFTLSIQQNVGDKAVYRPVNSDYFPGLLEAVVRFFEDGVVPVDKAQTMACMKLREAVVQAASNPGARVEIRG